MRHALALGWRGLGHVAPNPAVGCVLVMDGRIVGRGWTQPGGRPHAETVALAQAGEAARGATAYVTLEPCSHHGETGPCAQALIDAGVSRVVVALTDPDERVSGRGLEMLRTADIRITEGVLADEARAANQGFLLNRTERRPLVTLKVASSMDGRIATASGESQWITGEAARRHGHLLRATHDAILIGANTTRADDPELTCRIEGLETRSPMRVVMDSRATLSSGGKLVRSARDLPVTLFCGPEAQERDIARLSAEDVDVVRVEGDAGGQPAPRAVAHVLAASGVTRLLIEGGAGIAAAFMGADLVDEVCLFRAPMAIGGDGSAALAPFGIRRLTEAPRFVHVASRPLGDDVLETYRRPL